MDSTGVILIADDDRVGRKVLEAKLFGEKYTLVFASTGKETLAKVAEVSPDLILLDVMMPEMDGFEVCRKLKSDPYRRHIPIILITALDSRDDVMRGFNAGADDFLHKPVNSFELRARVRSMLSIKKQYSQLEATSQLRENLSQTVARQMRTPLAGILGAGWRLGSRAGKPEDKEDAGRLMSYAEHLERVMNNLLISVKMEGDMLILNRSQVDLKRLVEDIHDTYSEVARAKQIKFTLDIPARSHLLPLDANLFSQALGNLVSNALKFSPPEGKVAVQVNYPSPKDNAPESESRVRIKVSDEGPGIPQSQREHFFDQFKISGAQKKGTVTDTPNVSGLAFCKVVIEAHKGRMSVSANDPAGAVFAIEI